MQPAKLFLLASLFPLAACLPMQKKVPSGAEDFATYCAACHGDRAKGDGPMASTLDSTPADLTGLAARNKGVFPATAVMSKIWGYTEGPDGEMMPQFAPLLDGENMVLFDGGDGIATPTPLRLVQLAEYLKSIQR